jgi:hypothetical protein
MAVSAERSGKRKVGDSRVLSQWLTRFCIDSMLEHAVMHPIRHAFELDALLEDH